LVVKRRGTGTSPATATIIQPLQRTAEEALTAAFRPISSAVKRLVHRSFCSSSALIRAAFAHPGDDQATSKTDRLKEVLWQDLAQIEPFFFRWYHQLYSEEIPQL